MLNLFKLPFRVNRSEHTKDAGPDLAAGLIRNYLQQRRDLTRQELDRACLVAAKEMQSLQKEMNKSGEKNNYDLFAAALRRIEKGLGS